MSAIRHALQSALTHSEKQDDHIKNLEMSLNALRAEVNRLRSQLNDIKAAVNHPKWMKENVCTAREMTPEERLAR